MCSVTIVGAVLKTLSLRWLTWSELHSQSLFSELLSKRLSSRSCLKFRRGNDDRNWIYLFATEVTSDANLFVSPFRDTLAKNVRACHTRWRNLCLRNSIFVYFDGTNPITGEGIQFTVFYPDYGSWHYIALSRRQRTFRTCQNASDVD